MIRNVEHRVLTERSSERLVDCAGAPAAVHVHPENDGRRILHELLPSRSVRGTTLDLCFGEDGQTAA
jgi:hypothetical protein